MFLAKTPAAFDCYNYWQLQFRETIVALKKGHWRKFLSECDDIDLFKAYKYTKPSSNNNIAPLLDKNDQLTSNKEQQARLLFKGTSDVPIEINTDDIPPIFLPSPFFFPPITPTEIRQAVNKTAKKKAKGHDDISNETIKWGLSTLSNILIKTFNACLNIGYFPTFWKHAITTIIQKSNKDSYSSPNSY
jgi:hypothetical protein